jgi:hypothetical protein
MPSDPKLPPLPLPLLSPRRLNARENLPLGTNAQWIVIEAPSFGDPIRSRSRGSTPSCLRSPSVLLSCVRENAPHSDERAASDWIVAVCSRRVCATSPGCWPVNKVMSSAEPDIRSLSSSGRTGIGEPSRAPAAAEIDSQAFRPVGNASGTTHCGPARKHAAAAFLWHRGAF